MRNIRTYMKEKEGDYKEKIRRHRQSKLRIFATVLGVIVFIALALFLYHKLRVYTDYTVKNVTERSESSLGTIVLLGENIVSYSKDGAACVDASGNKIWNQTYEMQKPLVDVTGECIAITDYNGRNIYVMNSEKILGNISTSMPVKSVSVSEGGIVAAVLEDGSTTWINVYDTKGKTLVYSKTKMNNSGYPVAVALSPDATLMAVSYLYIDSGAMRSSVGFYNFGEVGQNELHNYVSGYNYSDTIVPYIKFINSETTVAVADDRIMFYKGSQKPAVLGETLLSKEILSVFQNKEYTGLVFDNISGETKYYMDLYNVEGEKKYTLEFDLEYTDIVITEDTVIIYNKNEWSVYTLGGRKKFEGIYEKGIRKIMPTDSISEYVIVTDDTLESITLK